VREIRHPHTGDLLDQSLVLRFDAPASATGEDIVEIHCHGGRAVVDGLLDALKVLPDLRAAQAGEFTRRAFANGRIDLTEAEGLADLLEAETQSQRKAALALAEGGLRAQINKWQDRVLALSARAERLIDYADEDDAMDDAELCRECAEFGAELLDWHSRPRIEPLRDGIKVVIAGPPNSGKSSLLNAMVGEDRSIVTDVPGTTRDYVEVPLALAGVPLLLTDTAGLRATNDAVESIGVARAIQLSEAADIVVWMGSITEAPAHSRVLPIHGKADLSPVIRDDGLLAVSAKTGGGIPELLEQIGTMAKSLLPGEDAVALNRRQAAHILEAAQALSAASGHSDASLLAEELRAARQQFDRLTGRAGVEEVFDALFSRFCLGK
jgi:tRNA modification GTPase